MQEKPPTQGVGVQGIASAKQGISQPVQVDWNHIARLPSFEMFAFEKSQNPIGDVDKWMPQFLQNSIAQVGNETLLAEYCQWHEAKGCWPNETPMGELRT